MARITGLGGIFFKVEDVDRTKAWYADVLGLDGEHGLVLQWRSEPMPDAYSLLGPFSSLTDYFDPSPAPFMINLRVDDLDGFLAGLEAKGIEVLERLDEAYGRFAWILDCNGVKIELWQQTGPVPQD